MSSNQQIKKLDKVVYVLGAGFSAPLGIPVMSNFLEKSKDIFATQSERYSDFANVFKTIDRMYKSKGYYNADLFNIEEILSILEMSEQLGNEDDKISFINYIIDVIKHFTPELKPFESVFGGWTGEIFSGLHADASGINKYGYFVGSLLNLAFSYNGTDFFCNPSAKGNRQAYYSVITLNYDMVLENCFSYLIKYFAAEERFGFLQKLKLDTETHLQNTYLAKLHGSVDTKIIVPPTWNKALNDKIKPAWQLAYQLLTEANHIRIFGYSLPTADAYIKYLLKAAIIRCEHLKSIDVLCLDGDHSVRKRYDEFICFPKYRFVSRNVSDYLDDNHASWVNSNRNKSNIHLNGLETTHNKFFV
jgi:hypothetical protein